MLPISRLAACAAFLIAACGDTVKPPIQLDAGGHGGHDAGHAALDGSVDDSDASHPVHDGGSHLADAGHAGDAGHATDAGHTADAGSMHDASVVPGDAGKSDDAGKPEDAGHEAEDSGTIAKDAGHPHEEDAGSDAGQPPVHEVVRFIALGDGGTGDAAQKKVAAAIKAVCAVRGCDFAIYMGDNIYETGAQNVNDAQFKAKFEDPYSELDFPFYVALGNHDYGSNGTNISPSNSQAEAQVEYTAHSNKWNMPHYFYTFRKGPIAFFALDTNSVVLPEQLPFGGLANPPAPADTQQAWLDAQIKASDAPWKIVFGHHPYISNGEHGNAGSYAAFGEAKGTRLKTLFEQSVCGKANVFMSGHDHDREWLEPTCGTTFIVSGAAAKLRDITAQNAKSRWGDGKKTGFLWVEVSGDTLTGTFFDEDGKESYEDSVTR